MLLTESAETEEAPEAVELVHRVSEHREGAQLRPPRPRQPQHLHIGSISARPRLDLGSISGALAPATAPNKGRGRGTTGGAPTGALGIPHYTSAISAISRLSLTFAP